MVLSRTMFLDVAINSQRRLATKSFFLNGFSFGSACRISDSCSDTLIDLEIQLCLNNLYVSAYILSLCKAKSWADFVQLLSESLPFNFLSVTFTQSSLSLLGYVFSVYIPLSIFFSLFYPSLSNKFKMKIKIIFSVKNL